MPLTTALTLPVPVLESLALKVVLAPVVGEIAPGVPLVTDQVGVPILTGLPYASAPAAVKTCVCWTASVDDPGLTMRRASGPALRVRQAPALQLPSGEMVKAALAVISPRSLP